MGRTLGKMMGLVCIAVGCLLALDGVLEVGVGFLIVGMIATLYAEQPTK